MGCAVSRAQYEICADAHAATGTIGWPKPMPDGYTGPHASMWTCPRQACQDSANRWVRKYTGHDGIYSTFAENRAARQADASTLERERHDGRDGSYVRFHYRVPAVRNGRVLFDGKPGRIAGFDGQYLLLTLDGETEPGKYHPTWHIQYLDDAGQVIWPKAETAEQSGGAL